MPNRRERRAARLTSTRQYDLEVDPDCDLPPALIGEWVNQFCERNPTLPKGKAAVTIIQTQDGVYKLEAYADAKKLCVSGPHTEEAIGAFRRFADRRGVTLHSDSGAAWMQREKERTPWKLELDPMLYEAWQRNDPMMPTKERVKAVIGEIIEQHSHRTEGRCAVLSHRRADQPPEYRRLLFYGFPAKRLIQICVLRDAEAEKEAQDYMDDPNDGVLIKDGRDGGIADPRKGEGIEFGFIQ